MTEAPPSPLETPATPVLAFVVRGAVAGVAAHLLLGVGLAGLIRWQVGAWPGAGLGWYLLGVGLVGGIAFGLAERCARWRAPAGVVAGLLLVPLALRAGDWALLLRETGSTIAALGRLIDAGWPAPAELLNGCGGALLLLGPLLVVRRREGPSRLLQLAAALLGGTLAVLAGALHPGAWSAGSLAFYLWLAYGLPLGFLLGLGAGEGAARRVLRLLRLEVLPDAGPPGGSAPPPAGRPGAGGVQAALAEAEAAEGEGRWLDAAEAWGRAHAHRAAPHRAARAAQAAMRGGDRALALRWLEAAGPALERALSDPALASLREDPRLVAELRRRARTSDRALNAALLLLLLLLGLLALALGDRTRTAELTRLRIRARVAFDPAALAGLGEALLRAGDDPPAAWIPRAVGHLPGLVDQDCDAALLAYRAAAEAGHVPAMVPCARLSEQVARGAERPESRRWYRAAAEGGDSEGMRRWAFVLRTGWGGERPDPESAERWEAKAGGRHATPLSQGVETDPGAPDWAEDLVDRAPRPAPPPPGPAMRDPPPRQTETEAETGGEQEASE